MGTVNTELDTERHCSYLPKKKIKKSQARKCVVYETIRPVTGTVRAREGLSGAGARMRRRRKAQDVACSLFRSSRGLSGLDLCFGMLALLHEKM